MNEPNGPRTIVTDAPPATLAIAVDRASELRASELAAFLRDVANRRGKSIAVEFALDRIAAALAVGNERTVALADTRAAFALLGWRQPTERKIVRASPTTRRPETTCVRGSRESW